MMNEFQKDLDELLAGHKIEQVKDYLSSSLEKAIRNKQTELIIVILNEAIGFYRDITEYETSVKYADSLLGLINRIDFDDNAKFISYINIANAYRAAKMLDEAINLFINAKNIFLERKLDNKYEYSALLNNLALAFMAKGSFKDAIGCFEESITYDSSNKYRLATAYTNLSSCYLEQGILDNAKDYLDKAESIFEADNQKDFHYSGYLHARAKLYELEGDIDMAITYYEKSLSYLDETVGKNAVYQDTLKYLKGLYKNMEREYTIKGLKLNKQYFELYKPFILSLTEKERELVAACSIGFGSEMLGLDDEISEDHDFEPGFIILVSDDASEQLFAKLKKRYEELPKHFKRFYIRNLAKRNGVFRLKDWLMQFGISDRNSISEEQAYYISNGVIFMDSSHMIEKIRDTARENYENSYATNLFRQAIKLAQISEYNLSRMKKRGDMLSVSYLKNELNLELIKWCYLLAHKYFVSTKWSVRLIIDNKRIEKYRPLVIKALSEGITEEDYRTISRLIVNYFCEIGFIKYKDSDYVLDYQTELKETISEYNDKLPIVKKIVAIEWQMFDKTKNFGGRADCQDNFAYFNLMRRSQYLSWNIELLKSYLADLEDGLKNGVNFITNKYAYMAKNNDPQYFKKIKGLLPPISSYREALQEEIIRVQIAGLEEFLQTHPAMRSNIRTIYSHEDSNCSTSYETYLRGEISTYSEHTLLCYARYVATLEVNGDSIAQKIIRMTAFLANTSVIA